ncbi:MAG: DUF1028 domain-containing protein [Rhodospirillales bacterium]
MTFSVAARCAETGMFGAVVSSSSPAVGARCAFARADAGAALSQNVTDPRLGVRLLDLMAAGESAEDAVAAVSQTAEHAEYRQLAAVDGLGGGGVFSGAKTLGTYNTARGANVVSAGNLLSGAALPQIMVDAFLSARGHLAARLLHAMQAGVDAGGEEGSVHSAGLKIAGDVDWPIADLRVDWTEACPIAELTRIWRLYEPQLENYVTRALDPSAAPSYGVPGDE